MTTPWQRFPRRVALAGVAVATLGPAACSGAEPAGEPTSTPPPIVVERPAGGAPTAPTDPTDPAEPAAPTATDTPTVMDVDPPHRRSGSRGAGRVKPSGSAPAGGAAWATTTATTASSSSSPVTACQVAQRVRHRGRRGGPG